MTVNEWISCLHDTLQTFIIAPGMTFPSLAFKKLLDTSCLWARLCLVKLFLVTTLGPGEIYFKGTLGYSVAPCLCLLGFNG